MTCSACPAPEARRWNGFPAVRRTAFLAFTLALALLLPRPAATATDVQVRILASEATPDGHFRVHHSVPPGHYFILLGGADPARVATPLDLRPAGAEAGALDGNLARTGAAFFQVRAVPESEPLDADGDGIDDLYELGRRPLLDPLDPSDARQDPDGDGLTSIEEYLRGTDPGTANGRITTFTSSPAAGEAEVAVTRETVLDFSAPLAAAPAVGTNAVFAEFAGRRLLTRLELASDRRKATLFYLENLPGSARVQVTVDGDLLGDAAGLGIDADRDGRPGGRARFHFDTVNLTPAPQTAVVGRVLASELAASAPGGSPATDRPLAGVTITVDGREQDLRAVTDADGRFVLSPAPAGTFFVHIDGRTAAASSWPGGAYYPFVGKAWEAMAGSTNNPAGGTGLIYLPLIPAGALQTVSATQPTPVGFAPEVLARNPELAGVEITVPANALFNDAGVRGGRVGIAPVPPNRLPSPLPPGLDLPLVITVQTDGPQNFDRPVPVRFPNTPDPVTKQPLPPGAKSALWSFNHDTGRWEIVGPMTVTADGRFVETDPGVGLRQPGWHGQRPGTTGNAPPGPPPPNFCDQVAAQAATSFYGCAGGKALSGALKSAGGLTIDAVGSTIPGEGIVAFIVSSAGTYAVREGTFGEPGGSITDALQFEKICCACLAKAGVFGSAGCGGKDGLALPVLAAHARPLAVSVDLTTLIGFGDSDRAATAAAIARLEALTDRYVANATRHLQRVAQARALVGNARTDSDLDPATLAAVRAIDAELKSLLGNDSPIAFYGAQLALLQNAEDEVMTRLGIEGSGPAYYQLQNLTTGTTLRGRTDPRGGLPDLILAPRQNYRLIRVDADTLAVAVSEFPSAATGLRTIIPRGFWIQDPAHLADSDADGLADLAEAALGTSPTKADTDGDGVSDAAEIAAATDPLGGLNPVTGVIGSADTPGNAYDVAVAGNLAAVADGTQGVTLFDVSRPQQPVALAQVDTPGTAVAVALESGRVFVADSAAGLTIIETRAPVAPAISRTIGLGSPAIAVAILPNFVAVGLADGRVVIVDPNSGRAPTSVGLGSRVSDLAADESGHLWAATGTSLIALELSGLATRLEPIGSAVIAYFPEGITGRRRLALANQRAYVTGYPGFDVFDIADPTAPVRLGSAIDAGPNSFKQIVPAAPGLGIAAVGVNPRPDGTHDLWLYDLSNPAATTNFLAVLPTPGIAHALALHRGRVLVADGDSGLQVINPVSPDTAGRPPQVTVTTSAVNGDIEEGATLRILAHATDDVFVRNVEIVVNGDVFLDDGAYPFGAAYVAPLLSTGPTNLVIRARAYDTGGNATWSPEVVVRVVRDHTGPGMAYVSPPNTAVVGQTRTVLAVFSEALLPESIGGSFRLWKLTDGTTVVDPDTPGSPTIPGTTTLAGNVLAFQVTDPLPPGRYLAQIEPSLRDRAGNLLARAYRWQFVTAAFVDADADGVPDDLEPALGLTPGSFDSNGNGVPDGQEDFDRDGAPNAWETLAGLDPRNPRTLDPLRLDGILDTDADGLPDWRELQQGTDKDHPDTDGDGWADGPEVDLGSNPLDPRSRPVLSSPWGPVTVLQPGLSDPVSGGGRTPVVTAAPMILVPGISSQGGFGALPMTPSVAPIVLVPGGSATGTFSGQPYALPPVSIRLEAP